MNRDCFPGAFMQLTELQPAHHYHQYYDISQASLMAASYDAAAAGDSGDPAPGPAAPAGPSSYQHYSPRKRRVSHFSDEYEAMSGCETPLSAPQASLAAAVSKRRKVSSYGAGSAYDDDGEDSRSTRTLPAKKQNHSEIEKRRRDKMNTYISELSAIVPMCGAMARKLDKLTVLRMAVQHLRSVRGALSSCPLTACPRPAYVTERELNDLVLAAGRDAAVLVVGCDRGRLLYVSASIAPMLNYDKSELLGQSLFDILHPKDVAKVKEQLSSSDLNPRERLIDVKTMLPVKTDPSGGATRLCPGARRSFFCRIKTAAPNSGGATPARAGGATPVRAARDLEPAKLRKKNEKKYCVVQCTGYLKLWRAGAGSGGGSAESGGSGGSGAEDEVAELSCLVAVWRTLHHMLPAAPAPAPRPRTRSLQFFSRHANDGKYLFVDQRVTLALGFLPQELLGTSLYELVAGAALGVVARAHKAALTRRAAQRTPPYAARRKDGRLALLQTHFKPFRNPWTKDVECLVAEHSVVPDAPPRPPCDAAHHHAESFEAGAGEAGAGAESDSEVQRLIDSQVESHKIGSAIAEEALRRSPGAALALDLPADLLYDAILADDAAQVPPPLSFLDALLCARRWIERRRCRPRRRRWTGTARQPWRSSCLCWRPTRGWAARSTSPGCRGRCPDPPRPARCERRAPSSPAPAARSVRSLSVGHIVRSVYRPLPRFRVPANSKLFDRPSAVS